MLSDRKRFERTCCCLRRARSARTAQRRWAHRPVLYGVSPTVFILSNLLPPQGSLSTDGTEALAASPWASSYGMSPGGANGVTGMSWAPEVKINGFLARSQSTPGGGDAS